MCDESASRRADWRDGLFLGELMVKRTTRFDARRAAWQRLCAIGLAGALLSGQVGATVAIPAPAKVGVSASPQPADMVSPPLPDAGMPSGNQPIFGEAPPPMSKPIGLSTILADLDTFAAFGREFAAIADDNPSVRFRAFKAILSDRLLGRIVFGGAILIFAVVFFRRRHRRRIGWGVISNRSSRPCMPRKREG